MLKTGPLSVPTKLLFPFVFLSQFIATFYAAFQVESPFLFDVLSRLTFFWLLSWWLVEDSRRRGVTWPMDTGMLVLIGWFVLLPYHLFKTRGIRALIGIFALIGTMVAGWLASAVLIVLFWY